MDTPTADAARIREIAHEVRGVDRARDAARLIECLAALVEDTGAVLDCDVDRGVTELLAVLNREPA